MSHGCYTKMLRLRRHHGTRVFVVHMQYDMRSQHTHRHRHQARACSRVPCYFDSASFGWQSMCQRQISKTPNKRWKKIAKILSRMWVKVVRIQWPRSNRRLPKNGNAKRLESNFRRHCAISLSHALKKDRICGICVRLPTKIERFATLYGVRLQPNWRWKRMRQRPNGPYCDNNSA